MLSLPDYPVRQRDFLLEISRAITARLDLTEVLKRVLHASVVMTAARVGLVALHDNEQGMFSIRAYTGIQGERIPAVNARLREIMEAVYERGMDFEYLNTELANMAESLQEGLRQAVAMPLVFDKKPLGLLIVFRSYQADVTRDDMQILHSFADQAAIAVHNAQLYHSIQQERQRLSAILDSSGDGVMILDADLDILQVNPSFEYMTGWRAEEAVGKNVDDVIRWKTIEQDDIRDVLDAGWLQETDDTAKQEASNSFYVEGDLERRDGMRISIGITYAPLIGTDGKLVNFVANVRDITNFRRAQEMQNVFISTVSHELRTPVALIKGYASTLTREDASWDTQTLKGSLDVIEDEADRLTELIEDLLTASKIQAERDVSIVFADVNIETIAQSALERMRTQTANHTFALSFPDDFPVISGDARLLRQVLDNLITNAIKYSPNGGTVTIGGRFNEQNTTVFVRDEGAGISEADQNRIFERFFRVESSLTTKTAGTGLGLYLVNAIIEAHGGTINVKSHLGHGSTFYFTLPRDES
ncbi:MAG: ATP-binding protein [Chloroflexota bacterium]